MLAWISDGGKTNRNHNQHYTALLPHHNPLLCCIFVKGGLHLYRYLEMGESIPNWKSAHEFFNRPTVAQKEDKTKAVGYSEMNKIFHTMFQHVGAFPSKVLHIGRRMGQQELVDAGVTLAT